MIFDKDDFKAYDADLWNAIAKEEERQQNNIELIASENVVSKAVMAAQGSILTNKYAEGYPGRRYYGGTDVVDVVETLAIERAKEIFGAKFANVQPHSGSQANCAAYMALIEPGDTVMGMDLAAGGHLTHGAPVSFSGQTYNFVSYSVDPETELLDFDAILKQAQEVKPVVTRTNFDVGIVEIERQKGQRIRIYEIERTLVECLRPVYKMDVQLIAQAFKLYFQKYSVNFQKLMYYAKLFRVTEKIYSYIEVLS